MMRVHFQNESSVTWIRPIFLMLPYTETLAIGAANFRLRSCQTTRYSCVSTGIGLPFLSCLQSWTRKKRKGKEKVSKRKKVSVNGFDIFYIRRPFQRLLPAPPIQQMRQVAASAHAQPLGDPF